MNSEKKNFQGAGLRQKPSLRDHPSQNIQSQKILIYRRVIAKCYGYQSQMGFMPIHIPPIPYLCLSHILKAFQEHFHIDIYRLV